ncbi:MAG: class I SAM-dependent methyltransferase [Deltaproteobacteria bacterium]
MTTVAKLSQEAGFFDRWADENAKRLEPVDPAVLKRYERPGKLYPKEYCFRLLGDVRGKSVLDVGCGEGEDAMLLASLGADVTGLDVSAGAINLAMARASLNGVSGRARFVCAPLQSANLPDRSFDVIWIDNVLHHVLDDLEVTLRALLRAAKPGALIVCCEPVNLNPTLRRIRFLVPVHTEVTPGERPLEKADLAILQELVPGLRKRHFTFLGRLTRFIIPGFRYESAPAWRRLLCDLVHAFDRLLLGIPFFEDLGGMGVFCGRLPGS